MKVTRDEVLAAAYQLMTANPKTADQAKQSIVNKDVLAASIVDVLAVVTVGDVLDLFAHLEEDEKRRRR